MTRNEALTVAKPILFNTDMVEAILDGRKTVTRRVIKPRSKNAYGFFVTHRASDGAFAGVYDYDEDENAFDNPQKEPYKVGDVLYVRETWRHAFLMDDNDQIIEGTGRYWYAADNDAPFTYWVNEDGSHRDTMPWKPSIHMPKEAARIFLRVTDVRIERLQDITVNQSAKEGCVSPCCMCRNKKDGKCVGDNILLRDCPIDKIYSPFIGIWNSTVKKSDLELYGWEANPWVRVVEFEKIEMT